MVTQRRDSILGGYGAGTLAGLIWGLAFLIPVLIEDWGAVTVTAGRYLAYGAASLLLFLLDRRVLAGIARQHWRPALAFAVTGNVGYYLLLVLGIELLGAPVTNIIIGIIPVTMAIAGNVLTRSYPWRALAVPVTLVLVGVVIVNGLELSDASPVHSASSPAKVLGVLAAFAAVALWTWYGVANAGFLTRHPELPQAGWSTVVGLGTGAITLVALPLAAATHQLDGPVGTDTGDILALVAASATLGVLVSWAATALWNVASARLSPTAAGMLINLETLSGLVYIYAALTDWPPVGQLVGVVLILAGVLLVVRMPARRELPASTGERPIPADGSTARAAAPSLTPHPRPVRD
jgi:drug/metabolite transporter (DMT)-like permease